MKITVVGSGLIGLSTAYFLAKEQHEVTVVDRQEGPALETSFANGGLITPSLCDPWNAPGVAWKMLGWLGREDAPVLLRPKAIPSLAVWGLRFLSQSQRGHFERNMARNIRLSRYNLDVMASLKSEVSLDDILGGNGTLKIARDQKTLDHMVALSRILSEQSIPFELVDNVKSCVIEPALLPIRDKIAGAMLFPEDAFGDAHLFCQKLFGAAQTLGVNFLFNTNVTGFSVAKGAVTAVKTSSGLIHTDATVIAAGSYSTPLAASIGVTLPVRPCKGYSLTVPLGKWADGPKIPVIDDALHAVVTPLGGQLRVAGTAEFNGFDTQLNKGRIDNLKHLLARIYPDYMPHYVDEKADAWAGLRPVSASGVPVMGKTAVNNCYVNTGHGHLGWTMAAGSGKALADLMCGRKPDINLSDYAL